MTRPAAARPEEKRSEAEPLVALAVVSVWLVALWAVGLRVVAVWAVGLRLVAVRVVGMGLAALPVVETRLVAASRAVQEPVERPAVEWLAGSLGTTRDPLHASPRSP
ncbi:MAG: hypothetical protein MUC96_08625 [Myxococcaceae bacterium]|jgi:hypothetical protein|nr:hypothetical protein [Myxococcaceae bacterium]